MLQSRGASPACPGAAALGQVQHRALGCKSPRQPLWVSSIRFNFP